MRIAFTATLKPPGDPVPSGDRRVARALIAALELAGHDVKVASEITTREPKGERAAQEAIREEGLREAERLLTLYEQAKLPKPHLWFTYHIYYKATDWLGPKIADALNIPYVVAEASVANKRKDGPWDLNYRQTLAALDQAAAIFSMTRIDHENLPDPSKSHLLPPFLDPAPYREAAKERRAGAPPRLLTVAMLRPGVKLESYKVLSDALKRLEDGSWQLLIVGDGEARDQVRALFAWADDVAFTGALETDALPKIYGQSDLFVWPAVREGFGMAILEAQAAGLPVVAGRALGVPDIVEDGVTGLLAEPEDATAHAANLKRLIEDAELRETMGAAAAEKVAARHSLSGAAEIMDQVLRKLRLAP